MFLYPALLMLGRTILLFTRYINVCVCQLVLWNMWVFQNLFRNINTKFPQPHLIYPECDLLNWTFRWLYTQMSNTTFLSCEAWSAYLVGAVKEDSQFIIGYPSLMLFTVYWCLSFAPFSFFSWHYQFVFYQIVWILLLEISSFFHILYFFNSAFVLPNLCF